MSLMEPEKVVYDWSEGDSLYIDARFKDTQFLWTGENHTASRAWYVSFNDGSCNFYGFYDDIVDAYVRAVR